MGMWNASMVQSRQLLANRLMERIVLRGPRWHGSCWQRRIAESGSSGLSTLMIDIPGDLVWDLPCMQQASYLEGVPLMWMLPLYLHVNQKSDDPDDDDEQHHWYMVKMLNHRFNNVLHNIAFLTSLQEPIRYCLNYVSSSDHRIFD